MQRNIQNMLNVTNKNLEFLVNAILFYNEKGSF